MHIRLSDHFTYRKLLIFTFPSIAMMIFTSIYTVVDGFFVSNFAGKTPFAAVNLIMPVLLILGTVGFMFGTGGTYIVAKTCGEGDIKRANSYFSLFVYVAFAAGVVLAVLGIIFARPIAEVLGASGQLLSDCVIYARIILLALPFFCSADDVPELFCGGRKTEPWSLSNDYLRCDKHAAGCSSGAPASAGV